MQNCKLFILDAMTESISISEFKKLSASGKLKSSISSESSLQKACVRWFRLQHADKMLYSVPNGGLRDKITASIMKAEGVVPGVPDLFLMHPAGIYHGLYIEMKWDKNGLTTEQINFFLKAEKQGYKCVVCKSLDEFMGEIESYLKR